MKKDYQTQAPRAAMSEIVLPDRVSVAMGELAGTMKEGQTACAASCTAPIEPPSNRLSTTRSKSESPRPRT